MSYTCIVDFVDLASIKGYVLLGCIRFFVPLPDHYDRLDRWTFFSNRSNVELFWNGSVLEFYRLKALITLEQANT